MLTRGQSELLQYFEGIVARHDKERAQYSESMQQLVYWKDHVPYRHIVRMLRLKGDLPVCDGAVDCLDINVVRCPAGKHTVCKAHLNTCYLCEAQRKKKPRA